MDRIVGLHMIRNELTDKQAGKLTWHSRPVRREPLILLLSREIHENEQRMEAFNKGLEKLREDNVIEYFLLDALGEQSRPESLAPRSSLPYRPLSGVTRRISSMVVRPAATFWAPDRRRDIMPWR